MDYYMLTTTDNPYSPITDYDQWLAWDMHRYNSNALLARVAYSSPELTEADQLLAIQEAIDEIVTENLSGVHTKVRADSSAVSQSESISSDDLSTDRAA